MSEISTRLSRVYYCDMSVWNACCTGLFLLRWELNHRQTTSAIFIVSSLAIWIIPIGSDLDVHVKPREGHIFPMLKDWITFYHHIIIQ